MQGDNIVKIIINGVLIGILGIVLVLGIFSSFYTVDEQSQAIIVTLGKVTTVVGAGPHFKIPYITRCIKVPVNITQKITIGYSEEEANEVITNDEESRIMTGDDNIVLVDFFIEWKVSDPIDYVYNSGNPEAILKALSQSSARNIIGSELVDEVLTTGKDRIQNEIEDRIRENLEEYDIGVQVIDVKIQDSEAPNSTVTKAFKAVEDAKLKRETLITQANTYSEQKIPAAQSEADKLTQEAEAYYQSRVKMASGEADRFNLMYSEYAKYPEVTRTRMYLEMVEKIYPNLHIYINTTDGGATTLIPVGSLSSSTIGSVIDNTPVVQNPNINTEG